MSFFAPGAPDAHDLPGTPNAPDAPNPPNPPGAAGATNAPNSPGVPGSTGTPRKNRRRDLIFAGAVLALAGAAALLQLLLAKPAAPTAVAVLEYGEPTQTVELPLAQEGVFDFDTGFYTIHLEVKDGAVRFINSPCPDHICENYGWLREDGAWAACMPAKALLRVQNESGS